MRNFFVIVLLSVVAACSRGSMQNLTTPASSSIAPEASTAAAETFAGYGANVVHTLTTSIATTDGRWRLCESLCPAANHDWGSDSFTYILALRWRTTHDSTLVPYLDRLAHSSHSYVGCTTYACGWSDVPEWDSIAESREYEATHDPLALTYAKAGYAYVRNANFFALGACPQIDYQHPYGATGLKTLETDANAIKAALLLYQDTNPHEPSYLTDAVKLYAAVRAHFFDATANLYTVYVFDDKTTCTQVPHRFYASVNGDMIDNGIMLSGFMKDPTYLNEARASAAAVESRLADPNGIYADLQADNDIVEPLVEAMYDLATLPGDPGAPGARAWIITNAKAAIPEDRDSRGWYGRFFDGYGPNWDVDAWQTSGGLALAVAAAALEPSTVPLGGDWSAKQFHAQSFSGFPAPVITFTGRAVAFVGAIGDVCCEPGHAGVRVDGVETFDESGVWQNKSAPQIRIPGAILFAWRWRASGLHSVQFIPPTYDGPDVKEGGPYIHVDGYYVVP